MKNKNYGVLNLPADMPLKMKQSKAADYTNRLRTDRTKEKIRKLVAACQKEGIEVTPGNLEQQGLYRSTFARHKAFIESLTVVDKIDQTIKQAILLCIQRGLPVKASYLSQCGLNLSAYYKHREKADAWIKILTDEK